MAVVIDRHDVLIGIVIGLGIVFLALLLAMLFSPRDRGPGGW